MSKECLFCYVTFEPNKPKQKFCSAKCRVYFSRKKQETPEIVAHKPDGVQADAIANPIGNPSDPKEGSGAFYLKYGCSSYDELKELKNK